MSQSNGEERFHEILEKAMRVPLTAAREEIQQIVEEQRSSSDELSVLIKDVHTAVDTRSGVLAADLDTALRALNGLQAAVDTLSAEVHAHREQIERERRSTTLWLRGALALAAAAVVVDIVVLVVVVVRT